MEEHMIDLSSDDEALLALAREELLPSPEDHARIKRRLLAQVAGVAVVSASTGRSASTDRGGMSARALRLPAKVVGTSVLGAAVVGGLVAWSLASRHTAPRASVALDGTEPRARTALSVASPAVVPSEIGSSEPAAAATPAGASTSGAVPSATTPVQTQRALAGQRLATAPFVRGALAGPAWVGSPTDAPQALTPDQIEAVVRSHSADVKRACWEAYDGGTSAAVETVQIAVDESGHVSSAHAEGNNAWVGRCLERELKRWVFPRSGGTTTINLPYKFFNQ
jgi:hypothetical protein